MNYTSSTAVRTCRLWWRAEFVALLTSDGIAVLQVHATNDSMVPIRAARVLFRQVPGRKAMLELRGGHNDVGVGEDDSLRRALAHFWPSPQQ